MQMHWKHSGLVWQQSVNLNKPQLDLIADGTF